MNAATLERKTPSIEGDKTIESWLESHGAKFSLVEIDLSLVNREMSRQNQARIGEAVNSDTVLLYATAMADGDIFPPIVVYKSGSLYIVVDGNHRVAGCDIADITTIRAYVLNSPSPAQIMTLTYEANTKLGRPTTLQERVKQAIWMVESGGRQTEVASLLGVPLNSIKVAWAKHQADKRFVEVGVRKFEKLNESVRVRLNYIKNDVAFKHAAQLVLDAGYSTDDAAALSQLVNAQRTEKGMLAVIASEREARSVRIKASAGGRLPSPKRVVTLQRSMTSLIRLDVEGLSSDLRGLPQELLAEMGKAAAQSTEVLMAVIRESRRPNG